MSERIVLSESECDYSVHTFVGFGKKIKHVPRGWALNLHDIRDFIPVLRYEFQCYILINDIISPCRIKINPRIFYRSSPLRVHLEKEKIKDENKKIPIEIKFNKERLDKSLDNFHKENMNYIETKLLVGKSFNSKGWGLSKEVVSQIFPMDAYNFMFPVYIDGILFDTRINLQTRLFYSSNELSEELERLSILDPKQKVDARIIINEDYLDMINSFKEEHISNKPCIICGNLIDKESKSNKCFECLDKELTVLKLKSILEFFNPSESFFEEDLLDLGYTKGQIMRNFRKLEKYGLVSRSWDGQFQLEDNNVIKDFINKWG